MSGHCTRPVCPLRILRTTPEHIFFFFNDTATTEIYTLSLHDALPISRGTDSRAGLRTPASPTAGAATRTDKDRKSTRLNSSHSQISYAVFCLKKKKQAIPISCKALMYPPPSPRAP